MPYSNHELTLYLEAVETLRKEKKLSIEDLIENITSERSYRRYLNQDLPIPLDTLEKLIFKLGVDLPDILMYVLKIKQKPSGIIEFFTYTHYQELELAKPYYDALKNYDKDSKPLNTLVSLYVSYYEFQLNLMSIDQLKHIFETNKDVFDASIPTIESLSYFVLYAYLFDDISHHDVITSSLLEKNFYMSQILLFDIVIDQYLIVLSKQTNDQKDYIKLAAFFFQVAHMWHDAYFIYSSHIHMAYQKYLQADETYMNDLKNHLFYEHMLLSKPSSMYNHIITSMTNLLKDDIIKNDLLEALS